MSSCYTFHVVMFGLDPNISVRPHIVGMLIILCLCAATDARVRHEHDAKRGSGSPKRKLLIAAPFCQSASIWVKLP
jgi:hypothetical protein